MIDQKNEQLFRQCIESFYFGYREFTDKPDEILAERGLNRVHHRILYFIGQNQGTGVGGLLDILQVSKQALNTPLRQLIEMKLVESRPAAFDKRVKLLTLTPSGVNLERELTDVQMDLFRRALAQCPEGTGEKWLQLMHALIK